MADNRFATITANPITKGLTEILSLIPYKYTVDGDPREFLGFLAQEINTVLPDIVRLPPPGGDKWSTRMNSFWAVTMKAVQELGLEADSNTSRVVALETRVSDLTDRLDAYESYLCSFYSIKFALGWFTLGIYLREALLFCIIGLFTGTCSAVDIIAITAAISIHAATTLLVIYPPPGCLFILPINEYPPTISDLEQYESDGITPLALGATAASNTVVLEAYGEDPLGTDDIFMEVEVQLTGVLFTDLATHTSAIVPTPATIQVTVPALATGNYHWQARMVNSVTLDASAWFPFGTYPEDELEIDFAIP